MKIVYWIKDYLLRSLTNKWTYIHFAIIEVISLALIIYALVVGKQKVIQMLNIIFLITALIGLLCIVAAKGFIGSSFKRYQSGRQDRIEYKQKRQMEKMNNNEKIAYQRMLENKKTMEKEREIKKSQRTSFGFIFSIVLNLIVFFITLPFSL